MGLQPASVTVLTVTYGDRAAHVERLVEAVRAEGVDSIVVVDNASESGSAARLRKLSTSSGIELLPRERNEGSAGGYHAGLSHFLERDERPWTWLLDDDNLPVRGALVALLRCAEQEAASSSERDRIALLSLRPDRLYLREVAEGRPVAQAYPPRSSFLGFELRDVPAKVLRRVRRGRPRTPASGRPIEVPFGPYGGLLLSRALLSTIGLPDRAFHLYADDNEFTARISAAGARLLLVPSSVVQDAEEGWNAARRGGSSMSRWLEAGDDERIFHAVRNQVVFERRHWVDDEPRYLRNRRLYLWLLQRWAGTDAKRNRLDVIRRAISAGDAMA